MPNGPSRKVPAWRSSRVPNTLGESKRGTQSQSIAPSGATSAPVWQLDRKAYCAIGGKGDGAAALWGAPGSVTLPREAPALVFAFVLLMAPWSAYDVLDVIADGQGEAGGLAYDAGAAHLRGDGDEHPDDLLVCRPGVVGHLGHPAQGGRAGSHGKQRAEPHERAGLAVERRDACGARVGAEHRRDRP